ncbi:riia domain-containing protein 1 [Holotrichia oblita]|uniref:Riia domain-containing protein 1 n=1 Tax=Holotrichia oblita TaxID=644536 RepID=A0ACB9T389_HOLOL|nr:riia domain-containing protein 1 [Holotrichia oblita]
MGRKRQKIERHVRCFCNLPICVSTGYMCKSKSGSCFSSLSHQAPNAHNTYKGLHGCLELLTDPEQKDWCKANANSQIGRTKKQHSRSLLHCCYSDMCNYVDNPETTNLMDESANILNERESSRTAKNSSYQQINVLTYRNSEVWFKAATIAVPICGAIIVLVLVVLAVRLLRTESNNHTRHKLGSPYISTQSKNNCDKYHEHYKKSHHPLHKETIPTHHNPAYFNHHVEELQQIRTPLLLQNELGHSTTYKNTNTSAKYTPCRSFDTPSNENVNNYFITVPTRSSKSDYNHHSPNVHNDTAVQQKNIFCDVAVSNSLIKCIKYDKANLKEAEDDEDSGKNNP